MKKTIEICCDSLEDVIISERAGSGVNESNICKLIDETGMKQYHSSAKTYEIDPTTIGNVSYAYAESPHEYSYNVVSYEKVKELVNIAKNN